VVQLCWSHGLYDAILYVYNQGMMDYTTPLEELLATLKAAVDTGKQLSGLSEMIESEKKERKLWPAWAIC